MLQQLNELPYDELVDLLKQVTDIKLAAAEIANTFDRSDCRAFVDVVDNDIIKLMIDEVSEHTIIECVTKSPEVVTIISNIIVQPLVQVLSFSIPTIAKAGGVWTKRPRATNATWSKRSVNSN